MRSKLKLAVERLYRIKSFFYRPVFFVFFLTATIFLFVFAIWADLKVNGTALRTQTLKLNRLLTFQQENFTQDTKQFLSVLSQTSQIKNYSSDGCSDFLKKVLDRGGPYINLTVIDMEGNVVCSAVDLGKPVNSADRAFFQKTVETGSFTVGDYVIGRITGIPTIVFGYPIFDENDNLNGVVSASLDLTWFDRMVKYERPPEGMSILIFDRNSTVVYSYPESEWNGQQISDLEIYRRALINRSGTVDGKGLDGVSRIYSYAPLDSRYEGLFSAVGSEKHSFLATIFSIITPRASWLTVVSFIVVVLVWTDIYFLVYFIRKIKGR